MHKIIEENIDKVTAICQKYDVNSLYLFGSATSTGLKEKSDIDILVSFKSSDFESYTDNYFSLHQELSRLFGRKVDLITEKSLKNPYFIKSIEETKQLLYAA